MKTYEEAAAVFAATEGRAPAVLEKLETYSSLKKEIAASPTTRELLSTAMAIFIGSPITGLWATLMIGILIGIEMEKQEME